jgi:signal peptidase I
MSRCKPFRSANGKVLIRALLVLALVIIVRKWVCTPVLVIGNSMDPTVHDGQVLFANKLVCSLSAPARGDVVFIWTGGDLITKRIIGLPGEDVALRDGKLYIDGRFFPEPYVKHTGHMEIAAGQIPSDSFAVVGDNRLDTVVAVVKRWRIVGKLMQVGQG